MNLRNLVKIWPLGPKNARNVNDNASPGQNNPLWKFKTLDPSGPSKPKAPKGPRNAKIAFNHLKSSPIMNRDDKILRAILGDQIFVPYWSAVVQRGPKWP